jgi:anti-sigma factor RsiW
MISILATPEMTCRELVHLITDYFEGNLSRRDRRRFERHLRACDGCTTYVEQMRETVRVAGALDEDSLSAEVRRELLAVFHDWKAR